MSNLDNFKKLINDLNSDPQYWDNAKCSMYETRVYGSAAVEALEAKDKRIVELGDWFTKAKEFGDSGYDLVKVKNATIKDLQSKLDTLTEELRVTGELCDSAQLRDAETRKQLNLAIEAMLEIQTRTAHMESKHAAKLNRYVTEKLDLIRSDKSQGGA